MVPNIKYENLTCHVRNIKEKLFELFRQRVNFFLFILICILNTNFGVYCQNILNNICILDSMTLLDCREGMYVKTLLEIQISFLFSTR